MAERCGARKKQGFTPLEVSPTVIEIPPINIGGLLTGLAPLLIVPALEPKFRKACLALPVFETRAWEPLASVPLAWALQV